MDTPIFAFPVLICQWLYAYSVALPFGAQNFSLPMKIGTYKKKTLKIDPQVLKISLAVGKLPTPGSDLCKKPAHLPADFQPNAATTEDNLARRLIELPAQRLHRVLGTDASSHPGP